MNFFFVETRRPSPKRDTILDEWVFLEAADTCSIMASAGAVEMLYSVTDSVHYRLPRQWAIDLMAAHKSLNYCSPRDVLKWVYQSCL
jgi:hypothetical protein